MSIDETWYEQLKFEVEGIEEALNFVTVFQKTTYRVAFEEAEAAAKWLAEEVQERIKKQKFNHAKLSPVYAKYKRDKGLDHRILIATGDYVNSIQAMPVLARSLGARVDQDDIVTWRVGLPDRKHKDSDLTLNALGNILEFGSRKGMPPRPHWRPVWAIFVRDQRKKIAAKIATRSKVESRMDTQGGENESNKDVKRMVALEIARKSREIANSLAKEMRSRGSI